MRRFLCLCLHFRKKSGTIKTGYKQDYVNMECDVDFDFAGPTVNGALVLGYFILLQYL
jgi:hypothetical protein